MTFSPDGRYLAATLAGGEGLRVFDRDKDWSEAFRDDQYGSDSYGAAFARDGRLATTSYDGLIRLYQFDPNGNNPNFRRVGEPVKAASGNRPRGVAFSPDGNRVAVGYNDVVSVDIMNGMTLSRVGGQNPADVRPAPDGLETIAWSGDGQTLFAVGATYDAENRDFLFAWGRHGLGDERRMIFCANVSGFGLNALPAGRILVASAEPCLGLMDARGRPIWTVASSSSRRS